MSANSEGTNWETGEPEGVLDGERRDGRDDDSALGWWGIAGLYFAALAYVTLVGVGMRSLMDLHEAILATQVVGIFGAAVIYSELRGERRASWPNLDGLGMGAGQIAGTVAATVLLGMAANALMALEIELLPVLEPFAEHYEQYTNRLVVEATGVDRILGIAAICLAAPLCEEALFRGTLLPEKQRIGTATTAVIVNGVLFSAFHQNPISFVPLVFVGAFLAHLVVLTESLWSAIFAHAVLNGFNGVVVPEIVPAGETAEIDPVVLSLLGRDLSVSAVGQVAAVCLVFGAAGGAVWYALASSFAGDDDG